MTTLKARDDKAESQKQWSRTPCGTGDYLGTGDPLSRLEAESLAWFDEIRRVRYEVADPWMLRVMPFTEMRGKRLLELGHGVGSDLLTFAQNGAEACGIDITEEHHRLAKRNFELHGLPADLRVGDAASLPWPDASFDVVYSHGVLHHMPDTRQCVREAHRVLRPGGLLIASVYHFWSAFHLAFKVFTHGLHCRKLFRYGYRGMMARIEHGADGVNVRPYVRTFSRRQLGRLLAGFHIDRFQIAHLLRDHFGDLIGFVPQRWVPRLEGRLGWYLVAFARK
jgi:SAM-dependent methyltransferase